MINESELNFNYKHVFIDEKKLIDLLAVTTDNEIDLLMFGSVMRNPVAYKEYNNYTGFYLGKHILRSDLGFDKMSKPGDFDIIIIPRSDDKIYFERSCAVEVKVVRPTRKKPGKNSNSLGERQIYGLMRDGFPVIGLVHICMAEPLSEKEKQTIRYIKGGVGEGASKVPLEQREMTDISVDVFSSSAAANQMKRLLSRNFPDFIGLTSFGINFTDDNFFRTSFDPRLLCRTAGFNPSTLKQTIDRIEQFLTLNPHKFTLCNKPFYER